MKEADKFLYSNPAPKVRRRFADIHCNVKNRPTHHPHQLARLLLTVGTGGNLTNDAHLAWDLEVPDGAGADEVFALMAVAERIHAVARVAAAPEATRRQRRFKRLDSPRNLLRQIAFYRLPYLPPLWIRPEAC